MPDTTPSTPSPTPELLREIADAALYYESHGWWSHGNNCASYENDDPLIDNESCDCGWLRLGKALRGFAPPLIDPELRAPEGGLESNVR